MEMSLLRQRHF